MIYIATKNLLQALAKFPQAPLNLGLGRNSLPSTINFIYPRLVNEARNIFYFRSINLTIYKDFQTLLITTKKIGTSKINQMYIQDEKVDN